MKMLSEITKSIVWINPLKGKLYIAFTVNGKEYVRTVKEEYFSNFPKQSVRFNNNQYLINTSGLTETKL